MSIKDKATLVSVVVPCFNEEKNIAACLESLLQQSYQPLEIVVVDDGSTDRTVEQIEKFPVKILKQNHGGPGKARNLGVKETLGEIIVFADSDMTFDKNFVLDLVSPIISGKYRGTFSKEEYISNWNNIWSRCWNYNQNWPKRRMIPESYPDEGQDFRAIRKQDFLRVGGFDNVGYTDTWSLAEKLGFKPHSVKGAVYYHVNPDNLPESFLQAKWAAKRNYKFGFLGIILALIRVSLPFSLLIGLLKSVQYREISFIIFKLVYDLGALFGIIEKNFRGNLSK